DLKTCFPQMFHQLFLGLDIMAVDKLFNLPVPLLFSHSITPLVKSFCFYFTKRMKRLKSNFPVNPIHFVHKKIPKKSGRIIQSLSFDCFNCSWASFTILSTGTARWLVPCLHSPVHVR